MLCCFGAPLANGQSPSASFVSIEAKLVLADKSTPIKDASQVVLWLTSVDHPKRPTPPVQHFRVTQQDKAFHPNFLVVPQGSTVDFPNLDPWFHNVFSEFRGKRFDLGLYQAGAQRSVTFDKSGISYLFCNIHPEMTAIIVSVDSNHYSVTDQIGHARIANVPPGRYKLHVWYRDALPESISAAERFIDVDQDGTTQAISLQVRPQGRQGHKNKYGHDYDTSPLNPEY